MKKPTDPDELLVYARRFSNPARRRALENEALEMLASRHPGEPEHRQRDHRPAGGGRMRKGS